MNEENTQQDNNTINNIDTNSIQNNSVVNNTSTTNDSTSKTIEQDEHYDFNYEMLMKATPYLKSLWREFDDLFFGLL